MFKKIVISSVVISSFYFIFSQSIHSVEECEDCSTITAECPTDPLNCYYEINDDGSVTYQSCFYIENGYYKRILINNGSCSMESELCYNEPNNKDNVLLTQTCRENTPCENTVGLCESINGEYFKQECSPNYDKKQEEVCDGIDNNCDGYVDENFSDRDGDEVADCDDNCPDDKNKAQDDNDHDNVGNLCDNCPDDENEDQENNDDDTYGDVCDNCDYITNESQTEIIGIWNKLKCLGKFWFYSIILTSICATGLGLTYPAYLIFKKRKN